MQIARVFPRRTNATPTDDLAFIGHPPLLRPEIDEVHVSVTFTWDLPAAEQLAASWGRFYPVKIGGPATGQRGEEFTPGLYLRDGYTITSRGCPNRCWFCAVWKREGPLRELAIRDGWNIMDDNLLACSEGHIRAVFAMLYRQSRAPFFTGGLEAARLKPWHVDLLAARLPERMFFAYDEPADWEPLVEAARLIAGVHWRKHCMRAYVLVGYPGDTLEAATRRLEDTLKLGFVPMAMVWNARNKGTPQPWRQFQREWTRPHAIAAKARQLARGASTWQREEYQETGGLLTA